MVSSLRIFVVQVVLVSFSVVHAYDNGVGKKPPLGWASWCTDDITCGILDYCNETEVQQIADEIATNGMKDMGMYKFLLTEQRKIFKGYNARLTRNVFMFVMIFFSSRLRILNAR